MEPFEPGVEYGYPYQNFVWVCTNPLERSFEKCDMTQCMAVWQAFRNQVQGQGLGRHTFVFSSGCMLGCKDQGTTVAILRKPHAEAPGGQMQYFRAVTEADVKTLIETVLKAPLPQA